MRYGFLGAAIALLGSVAPSGGSHSGAEVRIANYHFTPDSVTIHAGEAVHWTNGDHIKHTITFEGAEEGSPFVPEGATYSHRFDKPGVYRYHCRPHSYMKGVVVVR